MLHLRPLNFKEWEAKELTQVLVYLMPRSCMVIKFQNLVTELLKGQLNILKGSLSTFFLTYQQILTKKVVTIYFFSQLKV